MTELIVYGLSLFWWMFIPAAVAPFVPKNWLTLTGRMGTAFFVALFLYSLLRGPSVCSAYGPLDSCPISFLLVPIFVLGVAAFYVVMAIRMLANRL